MKKKINKKSLSLFKTALLKIPRLNCLRCFFFLAKGPITERQETDDGWRTDTRRNREGNFAVSV